MICEDCSLGGELVKGYRRLPDDMKEDGKLAYKGRDFLRIAEMLHSFCGDTCDCAHKIDKEGKLTKGEFASA